MSARSPTPSATSRNLVLLVASPHQTSDFRKNVAIPAFQELEVFEYIVSSQDSRENLEKCFHVMRWVLAFCGGNKVYLH